MKEFLSLFLFVFLLLLDFLLRLDFLDLPPLLLLETLGSCVWKLLSSSPGLSSLIKYDRLSLSPPLP